MHTLYIYIYIYSLSSTATATPKLSMTRKGQGLQGTVLHSLLIYKIGQWTRVIIMTFAIYVEECEENKCIYKNNICILRCANLYGNTMTYTAMYIIM